MGPIHVNVFLPTISYSQNINWFPYEHDTSNETSISSFPEAFLLHHGFVTNIYLDILLVMSSCLIKPSNSKRN